MYRIPIFSRGLSSKISYLVQRFPASDSRYVVRSAPPGSDSTPEPPVRVQEWDIIRTKSGLLGRVDRLAATPNVREVFFGSVPCTSTVDPPESRLPSRNGLLPLVEGAPGISRINFHRYPYPCLASPSPPTPNRHIPQGETVALIEAIVPDPVEPDLYLLGDFTEVRIVRRPTLLPTDNICDLLTPSISPPPSPTECAHLGRRLHCGVRLRAAAGEGTQPSLRTCGGNFPHPSTPLTSLAH